MKSAACEGSPAEVRAHLEHVSVDAFHRGAFHLVQPARHGHRAGMDAMMLAAAVPSGFAGRLVDLGAGAGAAGLAVAARCPESRVTLVELSPVMAECARRSVELPQNAELARRSTVLQADVTLAGRARREAGLADNGFDFAILNPPFNRAHDRATTDPLRHQAHVMATDPFEPWLRTAAAILKPRGEVALICRPQSLPMALAALRARFGGAAIKPLHAHGDAPAIRVIIRARRGSNADLELLPPLVLHMPASERFSDHADAINNGQATLFGD